MIPQWIIEKKRDGNPLSDEEIAFFIEGYTHGTIPDYQMAALAMAIFLKGMTFEETALLTHHMMHSGDIVDTSSILKPKSDKHSTGGIGDKVSLILAPLVACCGLAVPMISGRGLGITGGTLDKLESIPGYRTDLSEKEFLSVVHECGCAIVGQTGQLAPADKKLYALRDVTATVPSIPLITASIMCKKMAEGIDSLVLDVKFGEGAFMKTLADAQALAKNMVEVGKKMNKPVRALITAMDQPLGKTAGNALEVQEAVDCLQGKGPSDTMEVTMALGVQMLLLSKIAETEEEAQAQLNEVLHSGAALEKFNEMVRLQGGNPDPSSLPVARIQEPFPAPQSGFINRVDANAVGRGVLVLGAGRTKTDDAIDPAVGIAHLVKEGDTIEAGEPLLTIHANNLSQLEKARAYFEKGISIQEAPAPTTPLIHKIIS